MVETFTWLYGASQGQECRFCHDLVYPLGTTLRSHEFWCDARKVFSRPDAVVYGASDGGSFTIPEVCRVSEDEARAMLGRVTR